jgi:hypothetical protein
MARSTKERATFEEARDDVGWVFEKLLGSLSTIGPLTDEFKDTPTAKRPAEESEGAADHKRRRV